MKSSKIIKSFILAFLLILSSALFWKGLADIYLGRNLSAGSFIWLGASLLIFVTLFLFFSLLVDHKVTFLVIYPLALLTFFIFFSAPKADPPRADNYYLFISISLIALLGAMVLSRVLMQKERKERLNISVRAVFKNGLPWLMTFLALFIGLLSYLYPLTPTDKNEINLPPQILNLFVKPLAGGLTNLLPMMDEKTTIDEALALSHLTENINLISLTPDLINQLKGKNIKDLNPTELLKDPQIVEILKKQAGKISPQVLAEQRNDLAKTLGISLTGDEATGDVINKTINAKVKDILGPAIGVLPIVSAILTFIALRLVFIPFGWLTILFSLLIFQFLRVFKFVKLEKVMKQGEDVSI